MDSVYTLTFQPYTGKNAGTESHSEIPQTVIVALDKEVGLMNVFLDGNLEEGLSVYTRWSFWEEDMRLLSSKFPTLLFCLHSQGDEEDDYWDAYFWNGLMQRCPAVITYPPFNPNELSPERSGTALVSRYSYQDDTYPSLIKLEEKAKAMHLSAKEKWVDTPVVELNSEKGIQ